MTADDDSVLLLLNAFATPRPASTVVSRFSEVNPATVAGLIEELRGAGILIPVEPAFSHMHAVACPESMRGHVQKVLSGEYNIPIDLPVGSDIVDIGANVGAFAIWAIQRWPGAIVHCYEPSRSNFEYLRNNTLGREANIRLNHFAIGNAEHTRLFMGKNNCGEASFFQLGEQLAEWETVETKDPSILPKARVLKIDTEGCELEILRPLFDAGHKYPRPSAVLCEYHRDDDRRAIDTILKEYVLVGSDSARPHRGVVKYVAQPMLDG